MENMKKQLSDWSKKIKKAMIDQDMDTNDLADRMKWSRQYTSSIINGRSYQKESVNRISIFFGVDIPSENSTLARALNEN
jgi:DNA-binding helix-turn-helix protein